MMTKLPCGCQFWTDEIDGEQTMSYEPCSMTCEYYIYFKEETARQGKPITTVDLR